MNYIIGYDVLQQEIKKFNFPVLFFFNFTLTVESSVGIIAYTCGLHLLKGYENVLSKQFFS